MSTLKRCHLAKSKWILVSNGFVFFSLASQGKKVELYPFTRSHRHFSIRIIAYICILEWFLTNWSVFFDVMENICGQMYAMAMKALKIFEIAQAIFLNIYAVRRVKIRNWKSNDRGKMEWWKQFGLTLWNVALSIPFRASMSFIDD